MKTNELLSAVSDQIRAGMNFAEQLKQLPAAQLQFKSAPEKWNALECLEHLNLYGDYYLPELKRRIAESNFKATENFKPGWLGNYFANAMKPKEKLNKMKTFRDKNPVNYKTNHQAIDRFLNQQKQLLELVQKCREVDLNKTKTAVSISKMLKLKLGDTIRFLVNHQDRHIVQAENMLRQFNG